MFDVEVRTKITINSDKDAEKLVTTANTLQDIIHLFEKAGTICDTEIEILKGAAHIVDEILRGETF